MKLGFPFVHISHVCHCQALATQKTMKCRTLLAVMCRCEGKSLTLVGKHKLQNGSWHGSAGWSPACHCGAPGSRPNHSTCDLWWTKYHWGRFLSEYWQLFPVSTNTPMLQTHSFNYHPCYIIVNQTQTQLKMPANKFPREIYIYIYICLYEVNDEFGVLHNILIHELYRSPVMLGTQI